MRSGRSIDRASDLVSDPRVAVRFAVLRGPSVELRSLFVPGAERKFVEPPAPFVALEAFDTPNADYLGALFLEESGLELPAGETWGGALFNQLEVLFTSPDHALYVASIPTRVLDPVVALAPEMIDARAEALRPVDDRLPINPFTKQPIGTLETHHDRIRQAQVALASEIRSLRAFFIAARAEHHEACLWLDNRR